MKLDPTVVISVLAGAIPVGSVGAFFMYVSPLTILLVAAVLVTALLASGVAVLVLSRADVSEGSLQKEIGEPFKPAVLRFPTAVRP